MWRSLLIGLACATGVVATAPSIAAAACGDGALDVGEACDDGNFAAGDCCSPTCTAEAAGAPCASDGFVCTTDACDGAGSCAHTATPPPGCNAGLPGTAQLMITDGADPELKWRWRGSIREASPFGAPATTTDLTFCLADAASGLRVEATAPASGQCGVTNCWRYISGGYRYRDKMRTPDGIEQLKLLKRLPPGVSKIELKARGAHLGLAALPYMTPLTAWIVPEGESLCWSSTFSTTRRNDGIRLIAAGD